MIRRHPLPTCLRGAHVAVALLLLAACAEAPRPAGTALPPPPAAGGPATGAAPVLAARPPAAPAAPPSAAPPSAAPPSAALAPAALGPSTAPAADLRDPAALAAACRAEADRIIAQRDRGQLLREDERDARLGSDTTFGLRTTTDRLGRQFARDRLAEECVQENRQAAPRR